METSRPDVIIFDDIETELQPTQHLCSKCAHLIGKRYDEDSWKKWRCGAPQNYKSSHSNPVIGGVIHYDIYETCLTARLAESGCSMKGKWFSLYEKPVQTPISQEQSTLIARDLSTIEKTIKKVKRKLSSDDLNNL